MPTIKKGKKEEWGNHKPVRFSSDPRSTVDHILLEPISMHVKYKKIIRSSLDLQMANQGWATWLSSVWSNWPIKSTGVKVVVHSDFSQAFDTVSLSILIW